MRVRSSRVRGRLAPSPTGWLHLGNAWTFLLAWLAARAAGGSVILRMEDIDPDRSRLAYAEAIMEDLRRLGLDWDEGPDIGGPYAPYFQSQRLDSYTRALAALKSAGQVYPCYCTRKEVRLLAGAPHVGETGAPYPGTCRNLTAEERAEKEALGRRPAWRLRCPDGIVRFKDALYGPQASNLTQCGGDFALCRSDGVFAYQLAVVVDDAAMNITQVVRGQDILPSTPRQLVLYRLLKLSPPAYLHVPLLLDADGERLAKRHESLSLRALFAAGIQPEALVGLLGWLANLLPAPRPVTPAQLIPLFTLRHLPRTPRQLTPELLARLHA